MGKGASNGEKGKRKFRSDVVWDLGRSNYEVEKDGEKVFVGISLKKEGIIIFVKK